MSWLFSRVLVEEYLGDTCSDGEPSVQLNGNRTQLAYLPQDKMTDFSRVSRFGMTFKPLTADRGEELLTSYLEAFHAKTSPQPEREQELTESDQECGERWQGSFAKYDQDSSSWKTHQCSLLGGLDEFSETWPRWGLMRDGECWEQRTLEQIIRGTEYGLSEKNWPTPTASQARSEGMILQMRQLVENGTKLANSRCKSEGANKGLRPKSQITVGENTSIVCGEISNTTSIRPSGQGQSEQSVNSAQNGNRKAGQSINVRKSSFWAAEPDVGRVADGVAARVDRLKAIGNGQVPLVAATAWNDLSDKR
jgi:hypothetical protein